MFEDISFHEASLANIYSDKNFLRLCLEDVVQADGLKVIGYLILNGVSRIDVDSVMSSSLQMESPDGEIIDLDCTDNELNMIVQWNDFTNHVSTTRHYYVIYDSMQWVVT